MKNLKFLFPLLVLFLLSVQTVHAQKTLQGSNPVTMTVNSLYTQTEKCFTFNVTINFGVDELHITDLGGNDAHCHSEMPPCEFTWCYPRSQCLEQEVPIECTSTGSANYEDSSVVVIEPEC